MHQLNHRDYYAARAEKCREMAARASNPEVAAIHADLAKRYERTLEALTPDRSAARSGAAAEGPRAA